MSLLTVNPVQDRLSAYRATADIVGAVIAIWPEHEAYCTARFRDDDGDFLARTEAFAQVAVTAMGDELETYARDYRWMCEEFLEEELYFRRNGRYRRSTFDECFRDIYGNAEYMSRYVRGILISQIIWDPHARAFDIFRTDFLSSLPRDAHYLEIGPGHGFFLYFASQSENIGTLEAWDVSAASIAETRGSLFKLGVDRPITIVEQSVLEAPPRSDEFDGAVISEVLEHLERPDVALQTLFAALKPGGRIFINAPVNSPAPDHIYLWESTTAFTNFVEDVGFVIEAAHFLPVTGVPLARAMARNLSISCVVIATKPALSA